MSQPGPAHCPFCFLSHATPSVVPYPGHGLQSPWEQGQPFTGAPDGDKILVHGSTRHSSKLTLKLVIDSEEVGWEGSSMWSQKFPHNLECVQDLEVRLMQGDGGIPASGDPVAMGVLKHS